jgi:hypothetical protein
MKQQAAALPGTLAHPMTASANQLFPTEPAAFEQVLKSVTRGCSWLELQP